MVKNLPAIQETWVRSLGWKDPLKKGMATRSSSLAWKIPWMDEPGRLQSMGSQRVGHNWETNTFTFFIIFWLFPSDFVECPSLEIFQERLISVKYTVISQERQLEYSTRQWDLTGYTKHRSKPWSLMCFSILARIQMFHECDHQKVIVDMRSESCDYCNPGNKSSSGQNLSL